jgi:hypothetical protein
LIRFARDLLLGNGFGVLTDQRLVGFGGEHDQSEVFSLRA